MSTFSTKALPDRPEFALKLLEYILYTKLPENASFPQYNEAVKDLERVCSLEMQKLAMLFADDFMASRTCFLDMVMELTIIGGIPISRSQNQRGCGSSRY